VIARLNLGGPAHQVAVLSGRRLDPERYETLLVHGRLAPGEESAAHLVEREGVRAVHLPSLGQPISPVEDLRALIALRGLIRRFRPHIVHSHTAKAGFLARSAALSAGLGGRSVPKLVHTFHGHVLSGYFGPAKTQLYRRLERALAKRTDVLVGVSEATVAELVEMGIAPPDRFRAIRLGLDLEPLTRAAANPGAGADVRSRLGLGEEDVLFTFVGRLAPIKRVDLLIDAFAAARQRDPRCRLLIVGDGELRGELEARARQSGVDGSIHFDGYRSELAPVFAASDCVVISSDNEGTPVSLIEAGACGCPGLATDVGGVTEVVGLDAGIVVPADDVDALGSGMARLAADRELRRKMGAAARVRMLDRYAAERLIADIDALYTELLAG
jgi:glycosyltransferase involved in cell wall biosynthesis